MNISWKVSVFVLKFSQLRLCVLRIVCIPVVDGHNGCIVVKGETAIFLDDDSAFVREKAYEAIKNALKDPYFLEEFANSVVSVKFISTGQAFLLEAGQSNSDEDDDSNISPVTATIAVAAASVSFVVASIFCYGFLRRDGRQHPEPSVRYKGQSRRSSTRTVVSGSPGIRTRRHFVRLEDLATSPTSFVTASISPTSPDYEYAYTLEEYARGENYIPTVTWSVSDITSDSASLRSGVSRTPSMLERIEEEEEGYEEGSDGEHYEGSFSENSSEGSDDLSDDDLEIDGDGEFRCRASRRIETIDAFDCRSQNQDEMLDVSELDACFTIVPGSTVDDSGNDDAVEDDNEHDDETSRNDRTRSTVGRFVQSKHSKIDRNE